MKARSAGACALPRASFGAGGRGRGGNGHRQTYQVRRAVGPDAVAGPGGEPLTNGATFEVTGSGQGVHAFASSCRYLPDCSERAGVRLGHHLAVRARPETLVVRWRLPLLTHLFMREAQMRGLQRTRPWADNDRFTAQIADATREITRRAGTTANPANYAQRFLASSAR
jgi:hypothetical protein